MARIRQKIEFIYDTDDHSNIDEHTEELLDMLESSGLIIRHETKSEPTIIVKRAPKRFETMKWEDPVKLPEGYTAVLDTPMVKKEPTKLYGFGLNYFLDDGIKNESLEPNDWGLVHYDRTGEVD